MLGVRRMEDAADQAVPDESGPVQGDETKGDETTGDETMHIHRPKPLHGLRETLGEIGIIVVGIIIAIGLEQGVEQIHWRTEVHEARSSLHDEIAVADKTFAFRAAAEGCISKRLDVLADIVERVARHEPVPRLGPVLPDLGNAMIDSNWQAHRASQTLTHFEEAELNDLGRFYAQMFDARGFFVDELGASATLRVLQGDPARLGAADLANMRVALEHERFDNRLLAAIAKDQLDRSRELGVMPPQPSKARLAELCAPLPTLASTASNQP